MPKYYDLDPKTCSIEELKDSIEKLEIKKGYFSALEQGCKRFINSVYGALGSSYYNCSNKDIAESITLQGQDLIKFSVRCVNEFFRDPLKWAAQTDAHRKIGEEMKKLYPDFDVERFVEKCKLPLDFGETCQIYGDSCTGDTLIETKRYEPYSKEENIPIEDLFNMFIDTKEDIRGKEFVSPSGIMINHYCGEKMGCEYGVPSHIIRHKTDKDIYEIKTPGHSVRVTEDHSLYVIKKNTPVEVRFCQHAEELSPKDIEVGDFVIGHMMSTQSIEEIISVDCVGKTSDYVYDIEMKDAKGMGHSFFGNGILLHNTDSVSAKSIIKTEKHPNGITIEEFYNENINNIGEQTTLGHESVHTDDKVLNFYPYQPKQIEIDGCDTFGSATYDYYGPVKRIIRHRVTKPKWKISAIGEDGEKVVYCTGDHSVMVCRGNQLIPIKPSEIITYNEEQIGFGSYRTNGDRLVIHPHCFHTTYAKAVQVGNFEDEYVYDIEMDDDTHTFYCNDILVHNSAYITLDFLLQTCGITEEQAAPFIMKFYTYILKDYLGWCFELYAKSYNCPVNLEEFELEKVARSVIMLKKKKYVMDISWREGGGPEGIYEKPLHKLVIKGVEIIKGESSLFCRTEMKNFVIWLLSNINENKEIKYSEIVHKIKEIKTRFCAMHPNEISKNQSISNYERFVYDDKNPNGPIFNDTTNSKIYKEGDRFCYKDEKGQKCYIDDKDQLPDDVKVLTVTMPAKAAAKYNNMLHNTASKYKSKYNFIHSGDKIKLYYIKQTREEEKKNPNAAFAFLPGNFPSEFAPPIDTDKQFNLLILGPLNRFIVAMGYPEVRENLRYTTSLL
jgi:intein/homing endonuclease